MGKVFRLAVGTLITAVISVVSVEIWQKLKG